jgi:hypothetical protein
MALQINAKQLYYGHAKGIIRVRQMEWEKIYPMLISKKMSPLSCNAVELNRT